MSHSNWRNRSGWLAARNMMLAAAALLSSACSWAGYLGQAGCGQASILWRRTPIDRVLQSTDLSQTDREALLFVQEVRRFAIERLGLRAGQTYTQISRIDREALAWNVSAAPELQLQPVTWWFPIVGRIPYLGYFSREEAEARARQLSEEGYDVQLSEVAGYSTLGWFDDPLTSPQLRYSRYYLASLLIHESTHATLWFPGDVNFNESFASFVEREGARQFFAEREGPGGDTARRMERAAPEKAQWRALHFDFAERLRRLYADTELAEEVKRTKKREVLLEFVQQSQKLRAGFRAFLPAPPQIADVNNAYFLGYLRYSSGSSYFERQFNAANRSWRAFFERMEGLQALSAEQRRALLHDEPAGEPSGM
ncbi:MAG: aminopeptidase [Leptospirales bacterium]|nr:aminopeptidase [Leptospirales bacterium]